MGVNESFHLSNSARTIVSAPDSSRRLRPQSLDESTVNALGVVDRLLVAELGGCRGNQSLANKERKPHWLYLIGTGTMQPNEKPHNLSQLSAEVP